MQIATAADGALATVTVAGTIDTRASGEFEAALVKAVEGGGRQIVVDFAKLDLITSAGIRVLVLFAKRLQAIGGGFALCWYTIYTWPMVIGGKELYSIPPFTILGYESMILLAGLSNLLGMLALARLPEIKPAAPYDPRFQEDRIGIWVPCPPDVTARVEQTMKGQGAEEVQVHA